MDISRQALFGKLNATLFKALESASIFCKVRGNPYIEVLHWLHLLLQSPDNDLKRIIRHCQIDQAVLDADFASALAGLPGGASSINDFSTHVDSAVERAWVYATLSFSSGSIRGAHLVLALVKTPELRRVLLSCSPQFRLIPVENLMDALPAMIDGSPEGLEGASDGSVMGGLAAAETPGTAATEAPAGAAMGTDGKSALARFCADLTERAASGLIDPVVGRDQEIRAIIDILLRRRQNNPLLTGDAGVGKTAIVEGLAMRIAEGRVPPALKEARLLALDVGGLSAGAGVKGEFESRLRAVIEEVEKSPRPIVLFVDEVHTLVGAGGSQGTGDAANLLKPALARGALRTIGATTWSEYKRHIEKDPALTRRFQVLHVPEPDEDTAVEMVRGLAEIFLKHHGVLVRDEAVVSAVRLSARYIPARQLPDKAISLLDTASSRVALSLNAPPARVDYARRRAASLKVELELLEKEEAVGIDCGERVAELTRELTKAEAELARMEKRWTDELSIVKSLLEKRTALAEAAKTKADTGAGQTLVAATSFSCEAFLEQGQSMVICERLEHYADSEAPGRKNVPEPQSRKKEAEALRTAVREQEARLEDLRLNVEPRGEAMVFHEVDSAAVAEIVADWTGIPIGRMLRDEMSSVLELPSILGKRIVGQDHALMEISRRIQTSRAGLTDPDKPVGVFFLVGPSGVGKTETALALAEALYGGEQNLISLNMSEFQERHTVSTLKGSPPGYVGYGEGGVLTEAVRRRPHSVILLDEIEKAHQDVYEIFYQVFDKGWMEDAEGRHINFKNSIIMLTSNVGSELAASLCEDPEFTPTPKAMRDALIPELRKIFPAAFLGRLAVVPYYPLMPGCLRRIIDIQLEKICARIRLHNDLLLDYNRDIVDTIIDNCSIAETGARLIIGFIEQHILPQISRIWLEALSQGRTLSHLSLLVEDGRIICREQGLL